MLILGLDPDLKLDPDPHSSQSPNPYPYIMNEDPKHCSKDRISMTSVPSNYLDETLNNTQPSPFIFHFGIFFERAVKRGFITFIASIHLKKKRINVPSSAQIRRRLFFLTSMGALWNLVITHENAYRCSNSKPITS
jgi:hypothetical protein